MKINNKTKIIAGAMAITLSLTGVGAAVPILYPQTSTVAEAATVKVSKTSITSVTAPSETKATIKWKKVSEATGYQIYRSTSKSGTYKKIKTITKNSTVKYTDSGLSSGKTYYYKVRAYQKINGKTYYGAYSAAAKMPKSVTKSDHFQIPSKLTKLINMKFSDVFSDDAVSTGYYEGGKVYHSSKYPEITFLYVPKYSSDTTSTFSGICGDIDQLIPGEKQYTYQEVKKIFGDALVTGADNMNDGYYSVMAECNGYRIIFNSISNYTTAQLTSFTMIRMNN